MTFHFHPRSQHQDCTLTPTPPWQQSLGLVTSSAEQEEACRYQDGGDEDNNKTPAGALRGCLENHNLPEEASHLPFNSRSSAKHPNSYIEQTILNMWSSPPPSVHTKDVLLRFKAKEFPSSLLDWDDFDRFCATDPHLQESSRNKLDIRSQHRNSPDNTDMVASQPQLVNIIKEGGDKWDFSDRASKKRRGTNICCNQEDEEASFCDEDGDTYNFSADLFSSSITDTNTSSANSQTETVRMNTEACARLQSPDKQKENICSPDKLKRSKCISKDGVLDTQHLDFVPLSQSTPNVKLAAVSELPSCSSFRLSFSSKLDLCAFRGGLPESYRTKSAKNTSPFCKHNTVTATRMSQHDTACTEKENLPRGMTSTRHSHRFTPKTKLWKPKEQRVAACDYNEVPPTPAAKLTELSVMLGRRRPACPTVNCRRTLLHQTLTPSHRSATQIYCDRELAGEGSLLGSDHHPVHDENQACDWSRDLFSDSVL